MADAAARKEQEDQLARLHGQYDRVVENGRVHFQSKKEEPHQSIIREGRKIVIRYDSFFGNPRGDQPQPQPQLQPPVLTLNPLQPSVSGVVVSGIMAAARWVVGHMKTC